MSVSPDMTPRSIQPSISLGSVNEYQLRLGRQRQIQFILIADETQGVQVKLCYPLTLRAIHERLKRCFVWSRRYTNRLPLPLIFLTVGLSRTVSEKNGACGQCT